ncbi:MAG: beta-lactamase family protein [Acidimicrobiales bacterium]|nr:beta-lactamase family protein [Acidimicrobiales bacterium]
MLNGVVHPDFAPVAERLHKVLFGRRGGGGAGLVVYHHGQIVADLWGGTRNATGDPWQRDTMAISFSATKGVVATVVHRLVDRGLLDYDTPVSRWWPEFAQAGKEGITLRHLLSHRAAMHRVRGLVESAQEMTDWEHMVRVFEQAAPRWGPGLRSGYHGISYGWLVGEVIRRVTGLTVDAAIQTEVVAPLGLDGAHVGAPEGERHRVADLQQRGASPDGVFHAVGRFSDRPSLQPFYEAFVVEDFMDLVYSPAVYDAEIPAANGVFTARSLARLYAALATPDAVGANGFLSVETMRRATEVQGTERDAVVGFPMQWRLGYHLAGTGKGTLPNGFGHFGYGGSGAWGDPDTGLAIGFVTNHVAGTPFGDTRLLMIGAAAVGCARRRDGNAATASGPGRRGSAR